MRRMLVGLLFAVAVSPSAWSAGGHYPVDDAEITALNSLLVESWYTRLDDESSEFAILPVLRLWNAPVELTAGLIRRREYGGRVNRIEPAVKWLAVPVGPGGAGVAVSMTAGHENGRWADGLLNLPVSYMLPGGTVTLHANLGWLRERGSNTTDRAFIGGAFEWQASDGFGLIGQVYHEGADDDPQAQLGFRFEPGLRIDHLDLAVGRSLRGSADVFVTVGVAVTF